jgi:hypothetical protein
MKKSSGTELKQLLLLSSRIFPVKKLIVFILDNKYFCLIVNKRLKGSSKKKGKYSNKKLISASNA